MTLLSGQAAAEVLVPQYDSPYSWMIIIIPELEGVVSTKVVAPVLLLSVDLSVYFVKLVVASDWIFEIFFVPLSCSANR